MKKIAIILVCFTFLLITACGREGVQPLYISDEPQEIVQEPIPEPIPEPEPTPLPDPEPEIILPFTSTTVYAPTWQEAYAALLQQYKTAPLADRHVGWRFFLHDINRDGTPELFLVMHYDSGHSYYSHIYTLENGRTVPLAFEGFMTDGGMFAPIDGSPWFVASLAAGSGGMYLKLEMYDNTIREITYGFAFLSDEGFEKSWLYPEYFWVNPSYEWYNLTIENEPATVEEFTQIFGYRHERVLLRCYTITDSSIQNVIFGKNEFTQFEGEIIAISHHADFQSIVLVEHENGDRIYFAVNEDTLQIYNVEMQVGMKIMVYFETWRRYAYRGHDRPPFIRPIAFVLP